jgi:hypothetical protein
MMTRHVIYNPAGQPTKYFWTDEHGKDAQHRVVFKEGPDGLKKMTGVHFDAIAKKIRKE